MTRTTHQRPSRRTVVSGIALGTTGPLLAACGADEESGGAAPSPTPEPPSSTPPSTTAPTSAAPSVDGLVAAAEVPVGSGVVLAEEELVVTQPTSGEFQAFSAVCTHRGCIVGEVTDTINCPCHGSRYSVVDGSVEQGPATEPLEVVTVRVQGGQVVRG